MLLLLTLVSTSNLLDRYVLSLVLEPIRLEFQLSDSQVGFLTGLAFSIFYVVAGLPIARWADRGNRSTIIALTTGLWSLMVTLSGFVSNFTQLLLVRVGIAVGEAGCWPPANSLISEFFSRFERPKAMAIYTLSGPLAMLVGYLGGSWLVSEYGWRSTFIILGLPGVILAVIAKFVIREPRLTAPSSEVPDVPRFKQVLITLGRQNTFRRIVAAFCVSYFFGMGIIQWMPTFFIRSHGMDIGEVGAWFAFAWGGCGLLGTYLGGVLVTRYAAGKEVLQMKGCAFIFLLSGLLYSMVYLVSNKYMAVALMAFVAFLLPIANGPIFSSIQSLVQERMRSTSIALIFFLANLIGFGLGPLAVGGMSDLLAVKFMDESLRYASLLFAPGYVWVAFYYWRAGQSIEEDIRAVEVGGFHQGCQKAS